MPPENISVTENSIVYDDKISNVYVNQAFSHTKKEQNLVKSESNVDRIKQFWSDNEMTIHGKNAPHPVFDFHECQWPEKIMKALEDDGFETPTPIQAQGWPIVLSGRDLVGIAQTGSGKTLCYVLPAFAKIEREGIKRGPRCLVLAPTRELAQQIQSVVRRYRFTSSVCLYGGASRLPQMQMIRENNPQFVIATPGRMNDFIESSVIQTHTIDYLVLDEADRMLDMGFEPQIRRIIETLPRERQTLMWSATWPKEVRSLATDFLTQYIQINVGGTSLTANKNIKQIIEFCEDYSQKNNKLMNILQKYANDKILIFTKMKRTADVLAEKLSSSGMRATATHSDKTQSRRDLILKGLFN